MSTAKILNSYKVNQYGIKMDFNNGDEKLLPWHSILMVDKSDNDVQISILLISLNTITLRVSDADFMNTLYNKIENLSEVVV